MKILTRMLCTSWFVPCWLLCIASIPTMRGGICRFLSFGVWEVHTSVSAESKANSRFLRELNVATASHELVTKAYPMAIINQSTNPYIILLWGLRYCSLCKIWKFYIQSKTSQTTVNYCIFTRLVYSWLYLASNIIRAELKKKSFLSLLHLTFMRT